MGKASDKCRVLILKVASRCNLNCSYCYMYNAGDTTYRQQPRLMSRDVVEATLQKVRRHCVRHRLARFEFVFHGGEPLLAGGQFYRDFVEKARRLLLPRTEPGFSLQTNGTLLTEEWCRLLGELDIGLGISLDGPPEVNDRQRTDHGGRGSYEAVVKGLRIAQQSGFLRTPPGILAVIDPHTDPLAVYGHLESLRVRRINFLLPYGTHDAPPPGIVPGSGRTPYADWLIPVFDRWFEQKAPKPRIRIFEQVMELILGIDRGYEYLGGRPLEFLVVETDGSIEAAGALKVCGNGFTKAGVNVRQHDLDDALRTDLARLYHRSHRQLPRQCRRCPVSRVCGGGFLPHRYRRANGFDNPSVLCLDLVKLIAHVQNKLRACLPPGDAATWQPVRFEDLKKQIDALHTA